MSSGAPPRTPSQHPIRAYRARKGLTLAVLAERAGVTEAALSRIEGGHVELPTMPMLIRLAQACEGEVTACAIFKFHLDAAREVERQHQRDIVAGLNRNRALSDKEGA